MKKLVQGKITEKDENDLIEMGKFYFLNGRYDEAIKEFENALKVNPKSADAYFNLGITKEVKNDISSARRMYEKVMQLDPKHKNARKRLDKLIGL